MNIPNRITVTRFFLVPVFAVIFLLQQPWSNTVALVVFLIACISDFFDGYLARKKGLVTDFGKLMDPLADKLLVCTSLVCFVELRENFPASAVSDRLQPKRRSLSWQACGVRLKRSFRCLHVSFSYSILIMNGLL